MKRTIAWSVALDVLVLLLWGLMILRYWWTGYLAVLLHPDYHWLAIGAGWLLVGLAAWRCGALVRWRPAKPDMLHVTMLPRRWSVTVLLAVAVFGLIYVPRPFASDTALARGIADPVGLTRSQPQRFVRNTPPEQRSLVDWIRTLNVYPEPDAYAEQPVDVTGFVIRPPSWPAGYLMVARFVLTCCAADAYPIGLPVNLTGQRTDYAADSWIRVEGVMTTATLEGQRRLVIQPETVVAVPEPDNPYEF